MDYIRATKEGMLSYQHTRAPTLEITMKRFLLILCLLPAIVFAEDFKQGTDYQRIQSTATTSPNNSGKVVVNEFFSYGCPWCYKLEPLVVKWSTHLSDNVAFSKVPVVFEKGWDYYAKAYYLAQSLDMVRKVSPILFDAIQNKKEKLKNNQAMIDFFVAQGVSKAMAESAFESSPTIDSMVRQGTQLMQNYRIYGVPAMVIGGQYKTDLRMAKSNERLLKITDYLIAKVEKEKASTSSEKMAAQPKT